MLKYVSLSIKKPQSVLHGNKSPSLFTLPGVGLTLHTTMNNHHLFPKLTLHFIIFLIVIPLSLCDDDEDQFSKCSTPYSYTCGSNVLDISYPFWGKDRPQYCGREGFQIRCENNAYHSIEFGTQKFRVLKINASSIIMTIARDDLRYDYCPEILTNDTVIDFSLLKYTPNVRNASFFHICDDKNMPPDSSYIFNCSGEGGVNVSFYMVDKPELQYLYNNTCKMEIKVPVLLSALNDLVRLANLQELLNEVFEVDYMAENTVCGACTSSGGICGSNSSASEQFLCFCRDHDEPQKFTCPPPPGMFIQSQLPASVLSSIAESLNFEQLY